MNAIAPAVISSDNLGVSRSQLPLALFLLFWFFAFNSSYGAPLQMVVAVAPGGNTHRANMRLFERNDSTSPWRSVGEFEPVLLGKNGVAWGLGLNPPEPGVQKMERDGRSPAGIFRIGLIMGSDSALPPGSKWTRYHQITEEDAWPDDPSLPEYNQLYTLTPGQTPPAWFDKHRMRLHDPAYRWLVVVEHNYPRPVPGRGSAIFLHTRRGEDVPSAGCTVMKGEVLENLVRWLNPQAEPVFTLLVAKDYLNLWRSWDLPPPEIAVPSPEPH